MLGEGNEEKMGEIYWIPVILWKPKPLYNTVAKVCLKNKVKFLISNRKIIDPDHKQ
jgi:hypothetical protein